MPEVTDPEDVVGVCSECKSDQPDSYMMNNPFAQAGQPASCKYCGGVVIIVYRELRNRSLDQSDKSRGI